MLQKAMYAIDIVQQTAPLRSLRRAVARTCAGSLTIHYACAIHLCKALALLLVGSAATGSVGMHALMELWLPAIPGVLSRETSLGLLCAAVAAIAFWALHDRRFSHRAVALALIPQQVLLIITSLGAVTAVWHGQYADGYVPIGGGWFILTDQIQRILLAPFYTAAIFARAMRHEHRTYWRQ